MVLDVVEPFHCSGSDIQQRVLILGRERKKKKSKRKYQTDTENRTVNITLMLLLTFSAILLTVSNLITVEPPSALPLRGTISVEI